MLCLACGPGSPELSKYHSDMASKLFTFSLTAAGSTFACAYACGRASSQLASRRKLCYVDVEQLIISVPGADTCSDPEHSAIATVKHDQNLGLCAALDCLSACHQAFL